jgi:hypothetical protein
VKNEVFQFGEKMEIIFKSVCHLETKCQPSVSEINTDSKVQRQTALIH